MPTDAMPPNFTEKTFTNSHKTVKFAKVFSLKSFPLYGTNIVAELIVIYSMQVSLPPYQSLLLPLPAVPTLFHWTKFFLRMAPEAISENTADMTELKKLDFTLGTRLTHHKFSHTQALSSTRKARVRG